MSSQKRIFVSVCEASADVHAAALVRAARERGYDWHFHGLTGPRLRELGVTTVFDFASHAAMLGGVLGVLNKARQALTAVERSWRTARPDLVVLLDSPELHLKLAARAKRIGLPVLYYIAPQTWASRAYRNRQIARDIDRLACILPFEGEYFSRACAGGACRPEYVGHPLFETLAREQSLPATVDWLRQRAAGRPILALLPGSRRHVIETVLPLQLAVIQRLHAAGVSVHAAISCAGAEARESIRTIIADASPTFASIDSGPGIDVVVDDNASLLTAAALVLVASGTATLHVAYYRKPMIVMYDAGPLLYWPHRLLGRFVLATPHLALVNILAGARIVPEFMPFIRDVSPIAKVAEQLLTDQTWRRVMTRELDELVRPLEKSRASDRVCDLMAGLLT